MEKNQLKITVIDDGKGFVLEDAQLGNGIHNMKKRAQEINGEVEIISNKNEGTSVQLLIHDLNKYTTDAV